MTAPKSATSIADLPTNVFEKFIQEARATDLPPELVERLRTALIEEKTFAESDLRSAVLGEEPSP